ncbi:MAG: hypothetical protein HY788_21535 [Deltaproteobacteria bacterium]|nr:hypothetical protein [Deltaproteobacteria bacterium]
MRKITRTKQHLGQIDTAAQAARGYNEAMTAFFADWQKLQDLGKKRDRLGQSLIEDGKIPAEGGMEHTGDVSVRALHSSNKSSTMNIGGVARH